MKILINHPDFSLLGGVSNHYQGLRQYWSQDVTYNTTGRRKKLKQLKYLWVFWDVAKFIFKLIVNRPHVVLLNPSLRASALRRDFLFLRIARFLDIRVVVFIHGFSWEYARQVDSFWLSKYLNQSSLIFVLAKSFKRRLEELGVKAPIALTTTKVPDSLLDTICVKQDNKSMARHLLFLARIHKEKGIFETIDTFNLLAEKYTHLELSIVGNGPELEETKARADRSPFSARIHILGDLRGEALQEQYLKADLYILPTYGEGMPTSVLEAMAFGLPVFTRTVGGLADFFTQKMGYITDSLDANEFAKAIEPYLNDSELYNSVSKYNREYARTHFMGSQVALSMEREIASHI
jgi:glycosyltransferase family 4